MKWFPTPYFLCRTNLVFERVKKIPKHNFLEVGIGSGAFLKILEKRGFSGIGIDVSDESIKFAKSILSTKRIKAVKSDVLKIKGKYSVIFAFEVLEHYKNDTSILKLMNKHLEDKGYFIGSVPAHMNLWGVNDNWAGHIRRYEKDVLEKKLKSSGFKSVEIFSIGVPICNITKPVFEYFIDLKTIESDLSKRTEKSGSLGIGNKFSFLKVLMNDYFMAPFYLLQRFFIKSDLGVGYLVFAKKR